METWTLDEHNELVVNRGQIKLSTDMAALRQRIDFALQVVKGELQDQELGVDYFGIIFAATPISMKVQELTRVINKVEGVLDTKFINVSYNRKNDSLRFYFDIYTEYGKLSYEREVVNRG